MRVQYIFVFGVGVMVGSLAMMLVDFQSDTTDTTSSLLSCKSNSVTACDTKVELQPSSVSTSDVPRLNTSITTVDQPIQTSTPFIDSTLPLSFDNHKQSHDPIAVNETNSGIIGSNLMDAPSNALLDADEEIRYRALEQAAAAQQILPPDLLVDLVSRDVSASVRALALRAVSEHPDISEAQKLALAQYQYSMSDQNQELQTIAGEILSTIQSSAAVRQHEQALLEGEFESHDESMIDEPTIAPETTSP